MAARTDISIWLVTFALTVSADLRVAVEAGMILAALLFISRLAATTTVSQVTDEYSEDGRVHILQDKDIPYYAMIFRIRPEGAVMLCALGVAVNQAERSTRKPFVQDT